MSNRRDWLKSAALIAAGIGLGPFSAGSTPPQRVHKLCDDGWIHLNANENPYGPSPVARKLMEDAARNSNRYQWDIITELISAIANRNGVTGDNVLIRAGSTEVLDLAIRMFAEGKGSYIVADPTFAPWNSLAERMGMKKITVPLNGSKKTDLTGMLSAIRNDTKFIHVCNPNNPTGTVYAHDELAEFIKEATRRTFVLLDEAYIDYSGEDGMNDLVSSNDKLIISRTFSKIYSMAGARIGYALAHSSVIEKLTEMSTWTNGSVSASSLAGAISSLSDIDFTANSYAWNSKVRKFTSESLEKIYIKCIPSYTNFIYFSLSDYGDDFFARLKTNKILGTRIFEENGKWSRITVGTMEEMQRFVSAIS